MTTVNSDDPYVRHVRFGGEGGDIYSFSLLPTLKARVGFLKAINILAPIISVSFDSWGDYLDELGGVEDSLEFDAEDVPTPRFLDISLVLGKQLDSPVFIELVDILLHDLKCNGKNVNMEECRLPLDNYFKLVECAFMENFKEPFMRWLEEKGLSGMSTYLRGAAKSMQEAIGKS